MATADFLQKQSYGLIILLLIFKFWNAPIYQEEIKSDGGGDPTIEYYIDELELEDEYSKDSANYNTAGFTEIDDVMQNLNTLSLLLIFLSALFAWKIKEFLDGSDDLETIHNLGFATSIVAILFFLYSIYAIPNALEDDWKEGLFDEGDGFSSYDGMFLGTQTIDDSDFGKIEFKSGPAIGWYLIAFCGVIGINLLLLVRNIDK